MPAFRNYPNGGKLYRDNAGRLTAVFRDENGLHRKRFKTEEAGRKWIDGFAPGEMATSHAAFEKTGGNAEETISLAQMKDALDALNLLHKSAPKKTLVEVVKAFLASGGDSPTVAEAVQAFLKQKNASAATLRNYGVQGRKLREEFPRKRIGDLDPAAVERLAQKLENTAFRPFVAQLSTFALNNGWIKEPLVKRAAHPRAEIKARTILSVEEVVRVLVYAAAREPSILEAIVLQLFLSVRPTDALALLDENKDEHRQSGRFFRCEDLDAYPLREWRAFIQFQKAGGYIKRRPLDKFQLSKRTRAVLAGARIGKSEMEILRHTGNAYRWTRALRMGCEDAAAAFMHIPATTCLEYYGKGDPERESEADRFFDLGPQEVLSRVQNCAGLVGSKGDDPDRALARWLLAAAGSKEAVERWAGLLGGSMDSAICLRTAKELKDTFVEVFGKKVLDVVPKARWGFGMGFEVRLSDERTPRDFASENAPALREVLDRVRTVKESDLKFVCGHSVFMDLDAAEPARRGS